MLYITHNFPDNSMETHIEITKPSLLKFSSLTFHLASNSSSFDYTESSLTALFTQNKALLLKYKTLQMLCDSLVSVSYRDKLLAAITKEHYLIIFDLYIQCTYMLSVPFMSRVTMCSLVVSSNKVVIAGVSQILIVDWKLEIVSGIDFSIPINVHSFLIKSDCEDQKELKLAWREVKTVSKEHCSGNLIVTEKSFGLLIKGVIGIAYTKEQLEQEESKLLSNRKLAIEDVHYMLQLTMINYEEKQRSFLSQKKIAIRYRYNDSTLSSIVVRASSKSILIALNSPRKICTRILLTNFNGSICKQITPMSFIGKNDVLPNDKHGRTSMNIIEMAWTPNNTFAVILFSTNYFCILSCLGEPLNVLSQGSILHFVTLPLNDYSNTLRITEKRIYVLGKTKSAIIKYKAKVTLNNLWRITKEPEQINSLFHLLLLFPNLLADKKLLSELHEKYNVEYKDTTIKLESEEIVKLVKVGLNLIRGLTWFTEMPNYALNIIQRELSKIICILFKSNDPMYIMVLLKEYNKRVNNIVRKIQDISYYGIKKELVDQSQSMLFTVERFKALLMFYYVVLFRGQKLEQETVLCLVKANICKNNWGCQDIMSVLASSFISILRFRRVSLMNEKGKTAFEDESSLRQNITLLFSKLPPIDIEEYSYEKMMMRDDTIFHFVSLYSQEELSTIIKLYNDVITGVKTDIEEFLNKKKSCMSYLYICIKLIKEKKFDAIFKLLRQIYINKEEFTLAFIIIKACLILVVFSLANKNHTISLYEVPTFMCNFLTERDLYKTFEQLKVPTAGITYEFNILKTLPIDCSGEELILYFIAGLLLKISEHKLAIELFMNSEDSKSVLLGMLILNNTLNTVITEEYSETWVLFAASKIKSSANRCNTNLFSACIELSSGITGVIILHSVLPLILIRLQKMLQIENIQVTEILKSGTQLATNITPCSAISHLEETFCQSKGYLLFLYKYFPTERHSFVFHCLLQEAIQILNACLKSNLITFTASLNNDFCKVSKLVPMRLAEEIKKMIFELILLMWRLVLVMSSEGQNVRIPESKLRLAVIIIRLSQIAKDERQKLEYLQQGINILKSISYDKIIVTKEVIESIKSLTNVLELYLGKWESIVKEDLKKVFALMESNSSLYKVLSSNMPKRGLKLHFQDLSNDKLVYDISFCKFLDALKEISLTNHNTFKKKGEELKSNLRTILENIESITGIPREKVITKGYYEWTLESVDLFSEANDSFNGHLAPMKVLDKLANDTKQEFHNKRNMNFGRAVIETWRFSARSQTNRGRQLEIRKQYPIKGTLTLETKSIPQRADTNQALEVILKNEIILTIITEICQCSLRSAFETIRGAYLSRSKHSSQPSRNRIVSISLAKNSIQDPSQQFNAENNEGSIQSKHVKISDGEVKSFIIYPIKRSQMPKSTTGTRINSLSSEQCDLLYPVINEEPSYSPSVHLHPNHKETGVLFDLKPFELFMTKMTNLHGKNSKQTQESEDKSINQVISSKKDVV